MTTAATPDTGTDMADLVDRMLTVLAPLPPAVALAALARAIDRRADGIRPTTPLVLPRLDALAGPPSPAAHRHPLDALLDALLDGEPASATESGSRPEPGADPGPALLGSVHEALLESGLRQRRGAFYTPVDVARGIVGDVVRRLVPGPAASAAPAPALHPLTICDPALGGGVFLLAAADELVALGHDPATVVERQLWGSDVDPLAVAVAEAALVVWARGRGVDVVRVNVECADPLRDGADTWPGSPAGGFSAVVGNPPFLNQLASGTSRSTDGAAAMRARWGPGVFRYTDTAAVFLLAATQLVAAGGVVAMIVPVPVLVAGDGDRLRRDLLDRAVPEHLWIAQEDVFGVGVRVCAPVLRVRSVGGRPGERAIVSRAQGRRFAPLPSRPVVIDELRASGSWGELVADAFGVPARVAPVGTGRLGDFCVATAGFRDQYYGLRPFVVEAAEVPPPDRSSRPSSDPSPWATLVTSGLIEPARLCWGTRSCRFDGQRWQAPVVDLEAMTAADPALAAWTDARLVPKVVVAAQTRVLEAAIDVDGSWFPSVPTIALVPEPERLWWAAAVVLAPSTSAWAMNRHVGAALSADALRISAKQLLEAPLPVDAGAWDDGVEHLRLAAAATDGESWHESLGRFGVAMARAYAAPDEVLAWWVDRLPRWR